MILVALLALFIVAVTTTSYMSYSAQLLFMGIIAYRIWLDTKSQTAKFISLGLLVIIGFIIRGNFFEA